LTPQFQASAEGQKSFQPSSQEKFATKSEIQLEAGILTLPWALGI
jgi:hypothetical protein